MAGASSLILRGIVGVVFGVVAFMWPGLTLAALVLLFGVYALLDGIANIAHGVATPRGSHGWFMILQGVVSIGAGIVAFLWPASTVVILVMVIGIWAVLTGVLEIVAAIRLRHQIAGEWLLALSGVLSMALGVLLFAFPVSGALVLAWWVAAYAFAAGVILIALGVKLRRRTPVSAA